MSDRWPKIQMELAFPPEPKGEAPTVSREGTESLAAKRISESPAIGEPLMEEVCEQENCKQAGTLATGKQSGPSSRAA